VIIETERLTLRPLTLDDAPTIQELFDDPSIAEQLPSVRYPLPPDGAERWIREVQDDVTFGCVGREEDTMGVLGGFVGLHLEPGNRAQIGGWCGKQFRHNGYAVEAGRAVVRYGYEVLGLKTIYALRKGRLWVASPEAAGRHLPLRHEPDGWHILDTVAEEDEPDRGRVARTRQLRGLFRRS
jgi:hypothetical protein